MACSETSHVSKEVAISSYDGVASLVTDVLISNCLLPYLISFIPYTLTLLGLQPSRKHYAYGKIA